MDDTTTQHKSHAADTAGSGGSIEGEKRSTMQRQRRRRSRCTSSQLQTKDTNILQYLAP